MIDLVDTAILRLNNQGQLDKLSLTDKFTKQESFKKGFLRGPPNSCSTVNETKSSWSQLKLDLNLDSLYVYGRGAVFGDTYLWINS